MLPKNLTTQEKLAHVLHTYARLGVLLQILHAFIYSVMFITVVLLLSIIHSPEMFKASINPSYTPTLGYIVVALFIFITVLLAISRERLLIKRNRCLRLAITLRKLITHTSYLPNHELHTSKHTQQGYPDSRQMGYPSLE